MTDIKLSQLASITSLSEDDLLAVSKSMAGSTWQSNSITAANVLKSIGESARTIKVAKDGVVDADNIKDAVALAVTLTPTQANPVVIQVYPGSYAEDNPINIPEWVSIYSIGGSYGTIIVATNAGDIFVGNGNSALSHFTIVGIPALSNTAYKSTTTTTGIINYTVILNCYVGVLSDGGSINTSFIIGLAAGVPDNKLISCINGGYILATSCVSTGGICAFCCSGTDSELYLYSCQASSCTNGMVADDNGYIDALSNHYSECDNAIAITAVGSSTIKAMGTIIEDSNAYDMQVLSPTSFLNFTGSFNSYTRQIVSGATVIINADDVGQVGTKMTGESSVEGSFAVGRPGATYEDADYILNIGDGRSYYLDQYGEIIAEYWSWNNTTSEFLTYPVTSGYSGNQLTGDGDAIVIGCKFPFPAIRLEIITTSNVGSSTIEAEYWDGSNWIETTMCAYDRATMSRLRNEPFTSIGDHYDEISQTVLENVDTVGGWNSAYDVTNEIPAWTVGYPMYAMRFRNHGALITGMSFRSGKIRGDGWQVSTSSGKTIRWGKFKSKKVQYIDSQTFSDDATYPPARTNLIMSSHLSYKDIQVFRANTISEITSAFIIPSDFDTASPLTCSFDCVALSANTGSISSTVYVIRVDSTASSIITGSMTEVAYTQLTPVAGIANSFATVTQDIDMSSYGTDDLALIAFRRNGTSINDSYNGDAVIGDLILHYYAKFV